MSHYDYSPVGYSFDADNYCLDCIAEMFNFNGIYTQDDGCNCAEHILDRVADDVGISDRYDERSFDSGDFPKSIPYHNDIHSECGPEGYGYGPGDPEWDLQYCNAQCGKCHTVIDGAEHWDGHSWENVCPAFRKRMEVS